MGFFDKGPKAKAVAIIDATAILDLHWYTLLAHRQDEIDFRFGLALGKVRHVQTDH